MLSPVELCQPHLGYSLILLVTVELYQRVSLHKCLSDASVRHQGGEKKKNRIGSHIFGRVWLKLISSCAMMETVVSVFVCSNGCVFNKSKKFFF